MGFDNECILNIQSLAGEYFCPVCRLLVYPNEAFQSQCTHLYCKPCLTYVVSTTRACPYDGYLVTEADAKPLVESNKSLAETIGKIAVHCLYHRSGCTWQGPLSECTSHCSGCAFGNSPVVCNRCGIQIVHRQVQEHAQNCPGVQPRAQQTEVALDTSASGTSATADQTQAATLSGIATSQAQVSQTTSVAAPGPDPNQKANSSSQAVVQAAVPSAVPSAEQWYQHQQQYQQYYQQYPGYDPYQQQYQNYYPYQQPAVPQSQQQHLQSHPPYGTVQHQSQTYLQSQPQTQPPLQPQLSQSQAQPQPQSQPLHVQAPVAAQAQNQAQVNQQQQLHPAVQTYPAAHGQPHPQPLQYFQASSHSQPHPQHVQMPHNQPAQIQQHTQSQLLPQQHPISQPQLHSQPQQQAQLQQHPQLHPSQPMNATVQPQTQHPSSHAVTGNHLYPQPHLHQPVQSGAPQQHTVHVQSHGVPHSQSQTPVQIQSQFPQQPPLMRPPPSHTTIPNQQQQALFPSPGQIQNINPAQQQSVHSYAQQPGNTVHQRPHMQAVQQPTPQQYFHHQPYVQQQPPTQLRPQGQSHSFPQHIHASTQSQQNVVLSQGIQHIQSNLGGRPLMPIHGVQSQTYAQTGGGVHMRSMHPAVNLPSTNQSNMCRTNNLVQSGANLKPTTSERQAEQESELSAQQNAKNVAYDGGTASAVVADAEVKTVKSEPELKSIDNENKPTGEDKSNQGDISSKEISDRHALENGEAVSKPMLKEEGVDSTLEHSSNGKLGEVVAEGAKDDSSSDMKQRELKEIRSEEAQLCEEQGRMLQKDASGNPQPFIGTDEGSEAVSTSAPISDQGKHLPHLGPTTLPQRPGAPLLLQVPPGPPRLTQGPGHPLTHHLRPQGPGHVPGQPFHSSEHFQPQGGNLGFGASSGRASQYDPQGSIELLSVTPHGPYNEGHLLPPPTSAFDSHGGKMSRAAPIGQPSAFHPNVLRMNGTPGLDSSSTHGLRDERFKAFPGERLNPFPVDPTRRVIERVEFEDDLRQFPRPSYLDSEPVAKFGNYSSRPFDRASHGFKYDSGPHTDPAAGTAPSRFLSPYRLGGSVHGNDAGDFGRMEPTHGHPDFVGRRLVDGLAPRSPVRDYPGLPPHGFRGFGPDDFDGREFHRFGDPLGNQFHEGRFSNLPGHFRSGEFEGPGNLRMVDHRRNDFIGQDGHPGHLWRGDHLGPHNLREPLGFGSRHSRMGDMAGPENFESFRGNRPSHPRLGEPGFRSSFSLQRFPNDGTYTGDLESFENARKRKPASMGWCRICKVDCETVEGLDLHSQTREHQKVAMDMVQSIKLNAKKRKLTSGDQSLVEDANKSKIPVSRAGEKSID